MAGENVWLYLVVSSDAQEETLSAQRRWGYEEAARLGAPVERVFEGVSSGKAGARELLTRLIAELRSVPKSQLPARVLMNRLDRTGRMPLDAISALNEIRKLGVTIRDRINGDYTFSRVIDQVGPIFQLLQAGFENEVRSDRTKAGHKRRHDEGKLIPAKPPYGVTRDERGFAIPDPDCAPYVREVFARWIAGDSPAEIVRWLREAAPPRRTAKAEYHIQWSLSHIYKMVHAVTSYKGVVVDEATWERAQHRTKRPSRPGPGRRVYPYAGLFCACGDRLHPRTNTCATRHRRKDGTLVVYERKTPTRWYVCHSMRHKTGPKFRNYRESRIDAVWVRFLRRTATKGFLDVTEPIIDRAPKRAALHRKLDQIETRKKRVHLAFEDGAYDVATMHERLKAIGAEERVLRTEIAQIDAEIERQRAGRLRREEIVALVQNAAAIYESATIEQRARINREIFAAFPGIQIADGYRLRLPFRRK